MREFRYRALGPGGQTLTGLRHAPDAESLGRVLFEQNLILLDCRQPLSSLWRASPFGGRVSHGELRDFTLHLATSLGAGVAIMTALRDFEDGDCSVTFGSVVTDIREEIGGGAQVGDALAKHPRIFGDIYVSLVRAGQRSGNLDKNFEELVEYLEWIGDLRARTRQAMIYPLILVSGLVGLFLLLMLFVLPRFVTIFADQDFELPTLTKRVIGSWDFLRHWWPLIVGGLGLGTVGTIMATRSRSGRYLWNLFLLRLPVIGPFRHKMALSRCTRHFSLLLGSGIDLLSVLRLLGDVVGDAVLEAELHAIRKRVTTGETLAQSFAESSWFPALIQRLVAVGEQSGSLDSTLLKAAEFLDKEIPRALQKAFTLFEAVVMIALGAMIALFALSLLLPILQMRSQVG